MHCKDLFLVMATCVAGVVGPAMASDVHVACVQEQLAVMGYDPGPVDGVDGNATRRALMDFIARLREDHTLEAFDALPEFSERAAVGWCREIGNHIPEAAEIMPAADPPLILTKDDVPESVRGYVLRSYEDARQTFAEEYDIHTASKPVLVVAFDRDDLEELLKQPIPGIPDLSPGAARDTANDLCLGVERVMGAAYRHRIAFCMPPEAKGALTSYEIWHGRYQFVMLHEYMHHVQREMSLDKTPSDWGEGSRMGPAWMIEGCAYMAQIKAREGPTREVTAPMLFSLRASDSHDPIPLATIRKQDRVKTDAEYAASNLAVALLSLRYGEDRMIDFWRAVGQLDDWDASFAQTYGIAIADFEALFEDLRQDNTKLAMFARAEGVYAQDVLGIRSIEPKAGIGHAGRRRPPRD